MRAAAGVSWALVGVVAGCDEAPPPCDPAVALVGMSSTIELSEGGRAFVPFTGDARVRVEVAGLAPGFTARVEGRAAGARIVVGAPYGITGSLPAEIVAACETGDEPAAVALPVTVRVAPLRVEHLWRDGEPSGPSPRAFTALAVRADGTIVVAGGLSGPSPAAALADAWAYDPAGGVGGGWAELWTPSTSPLAAAGSAGVARALVDAAGAVLIHDGAGGVFVLADHEDNLDHDGLAPFITTTGAAPSRTAGAGFVRHARSGALMSLCGGAAAASEPATGPRHCAVSALTLDDATARTGTWRVVEPSGFAPVGRAGAVVDLDREGDRLVLFGGERDDGPAGDAWALALAGLPAGPLPFTRLGKEDDAPQARAWACGAVDPAGRRFFVFGGADGEGPVGALAVLDLERDDARWRRLDVPDLPSPRVGCAAAWDPHGTRIVFGFGRDAAGDRGDLWALEL